ncbi:hypothetical protein AAVH_17902 [Aphelenchoides avenae]|nr:hypothetical protein AAVH_17902 [Aphelenchus avenae]
MRTGSAIFSLSLLEEDHRGNVIFRKSEVLESVRELFRYLQDESNEPLLTILVLVTGVAGGLTAVIGVVYIYVRFCGKRSEKETDAEAAGKCPPGRPPLPSTLLPYANAQQPIYQHFLPPSSEIEPPKSILEDLANDTKKIAQVFPLINKSPPVPPTAPESAPLNDAPKSHHLSSTTEKSLSTSQSTLKSTASSRRNTVAGGTRRGTMPGRRRGTTMTAQQRAAATNSRRSVKVSNRELSELQPLKIPEYRAEPMILAQAERRPSEMVPQRRPGTGRRLPSIDHLPPPSPAFQTILKAANPVKYRHYSAKFVRGVRNTYCSPRT